MALTAVHAETKTFIPMKEFRYEESPRWVRPQFGGEFIADTRHALLVWDFNHIPVYFFPREDVREEFLKPTGRSQGERTTYNIQTNGRTAENAA